MHQVGMNLETQHWCSMFIATKFNFTLLPHSVEGKKAMGNLCKPSLPYKQTLTHKTLSKPEKHMTW